MNIVVLAGGISTERSVSIVSGTGVCKALRARGERAILLDVYCGKENVVPAEAFTETFKLEICDSHLFIAFVIVLRTSEIKGGSTTWNINHLKSVPKLGTIFLSYC